MTAVSHWQQFVTYFLHSTSTVGTFMQMQQRGMSDVPCSRNSQKKEKSWPEHCFPDCPPFFHQRLQANLKRGLKICHPKKNPKFSHTLIYLSSLNRELLNHNLHLDLHDEGGPLDVEAGRPVHLPDGGRRAHLPSRTTSTNLCLVIVGKLFWNLTTGNPKEKLVGTFLEIYQIS